jgi:protein transport protein SEC23
VTVADVAITYLRRRIQFYEGLSKRASMNGHAIDVYAGCLDQVGLLEMKSLTNSTNGFMVISDSFTTAIFKQSFLRTLGKDDNGYLQMGFNGTFDVIVRTLIALVTA